MSLTRRQFLQRGVTFVSLSLASQYMMMQVTPGRDTVFGQASALAVSDRLLVVIQLNGGNDGLNTFIPYSTGTYYDARPVLAVPAKDALTIDNQVGLHPRLPNLKKLYDQGKAAIIQGVGYPNANRSHFRSTDIWMTANPDTIQSTGWLGRYLDHSIARFHGTKLVAANVGGTLPLALRSQNVVVPSIASLESYQFQTDARFPQDRTRRVEFFNTVNAEQTSDSSMAGAVAQIGVSAVRSATELQDAVKKYKSPVQYNNDPFALGLKLVAQIIAGGMGTQVLYVTIGGFDTHASQQKDHETLLGIVDAAVYAFHQDLVQMGVSKNILIMTFSEFGRRVRENGSRGTDHGTAAPMFVIGDGVVPGLHGEYPSLTRLDGNGDLIYTVDFRSVYATVLDQWLKADAQAVLGKRFSTLGFIAK